MVKPEPIDELTGLRLRVCTLVEGAWFVRFITALILINAVTLGMETDQGAVDRFGPLLFWADKTILIIFTVELLLKFYAYRLAFFRSGWNVFDLAIVGVAWLPASGALAVLRSLRILRIMRLLSVVPQMRRVITALWHSLPGMSAVIGVLCIVFYVSAVLATKLFGAHPDPDMQEWFGSIAASGYTLFQIMTLESWSMGIVRPTMEIFPLAWIFFVPFIIVTSFAVLNLFIGIIVDAMHTAQQEPREDDKNEIKSFTHEEAASLHARFDALHEDMLIMKAAIEAKKDK
jgi:voltage-gated sodium channel